jgi:DNA topoisomerase VI subunit B
MIKKLAKKLTSLLLKFKRKNATSAQDKVINSLLEKVAEDITDIAEVADKAASKVVKTAVEEAKVVTEAVEAKTAKTGTKKPAAKKTAASGEAPKPKGRPKKSI